MQVLGSLIKFRAKNTNLETIGHIYHINAMKPSDIVYHVLTTIGQTHQVRDHEIILDVIEGEFEVIKPKGVEHEQINEQRPQEASSFGLRIAEPGEIPDAGQEPRRECESTRDADGEQGEIVGESKSQNRRKSQQNTRKKGN